MCSKNDPSAPRKKPLVACKFDEGLSVDRGVFTERQKLHGELGPGGTPSEVILVNKPMCAWLQDLSGNVPNALNQTHQRR
jgi:hypothetical protein